MNDWDLVKTEYLEFLRSARSEFNNLIETHHAQVISRIGFAVQDMQDSESAARTKIQNQGADENVECIETAERQLLAALSEGGENLLYEIGHLQAFSNGLFEYTIYQTIDPLETNLSLFDTELFYLFSYFDSVANVSILIASFEIEIQVFRELFNHYVQEVYLDMLVFDIATNEMNRIMFNYLFEVAQLFDNQTISIVESLASCNK